MMMSVVVDDIDRNLLRGVAACLLMLTLQPCGSIALATLSP